MTADALNKVPLFARVEEGFIHALTQKMEATSTSVGEVLVKEGEVRWQTPPRPPFPSFTATRWQADAVPALPPTYAPPRLRARRALRCGLLCPRGTARRRARRCATACTLS